jgi:DNA repair protein RadA/Sms
MKPTATKTFYACASCGSVFAKWMGQCPDCGAWDTLHEEKAAARPGGSGRPQRKRAAPAVQVLSEVSGDAVGVMASGLAELDNVLGGGASPGSTVLLGGEPGIGKSTLMLQAAGRLAQRGYTTLYVSGEESAPQIKRRADRLGIRSELHLLTETDSTAIIAAAESLNPRALIVDSVQTTFDPQLQSPPGTVSQIRETAAAFSQWARAHDAVVFLVGHVTKDGIIAGPKVLEHLVDTVLQFEGDRRQWIRILRCLKNRYGSTHEVGLFEMTETGMKEVANPSAHFLSERSPEIPGSAIAVAIEGRRPLLLEIQALVGQGGGMPQRVMSGYDPRRAAILIAILQNAGGLQLAGRDVYLNLAGGYATDEPAVDLAGAMAIASAFLKKPVPADTVFVGEVGLAGEIRGVPQIAVRLNEAEKFGFRTAIIPSVNTRDLIPAGDLEITGVRNLSQALRILE